MTSIMRRILFACVAATVAMVAARLWGLRPIRPEVILPGLAIGFILSFAFRPTYAAPSPKPTSGLCDMCAKGIHEAGMPCPWDGCMCTACSPFGGQFDPDDPDTWPPPHRNLDDRPHIFRPEG